MRKITALFFALALLVGVGACAIGDPTIRIRALKKEAGKPQVYSVTKIQVYFTCVGLLPMVQKHTLCLGDANGDLNCK